MKKSEANSEQNDGNSANTQCASKTQRACLLTIEEFDDEQDRVSLADGQNETGSALAYPFPVNLRRNSISMPSGINALKDFEAMRMKHQMICLEDDFGEDDSLFLIDSNPEYSVSDRSVRKVEKIQ